MLPEAVTLGAIAVLLGVGAGVPPGEWASSGSWSYCSPRTSPGRHPARRTDDECGGRHSRYPGGCRNPCPASGTHLPRGGDARPRVRKEGWLIRHGSGSLGRPARVFGGTSFLSTPSPRCPVPRAALCLPLFLGATLLIPATVDSSGETRSPSHPPDLRHAEGAGQQQHPARQVADHAHRRRPDGRRRHDPQRVGHDRLVQG